MGRGLPHGLLVLERLHQFAMESPWWRFSASLSLPLALRTKPTPAARWSARVLRARAGTAITISLASRRTLPTAASSCPAANRGGSAVIGYRTWSILLSNTSAYTHGLRRADTNEP